MFKMKKGSPLIREIYLTYLEYKQPNTSQDYKDFCDLYVQLLIQEQPQNQHDNFYKYWETLKNYDKK